MRRRTPAPDLFSLDRPVPRHWGWFVDFARYEKLTGGPDPHMRAVVALCAGLPRQEQLWRATLYVGVYNVPTAESIWQMWPYDRFVHDQSSMVGWLDAHWQGLPLRRERRTVNSPRKLAVYLAGQAYIDAALTGIADAPFEDVWAYAMNLPHVGRYAATKLTEIWHLLGCVQAAIPDIRAAGGWSPRAALRLLRPDTNTDPRSDTPADVATDEAVAAEVMDALHADGCPLTWFELEVLLCEYKESYSTHRQYPGRSLDSELSYEAKAAAYWDSSRPSEHLRVRERLSPEWALGEKAGWPGVRDVLGHVLSTFGYVWSDSLYDYCATKDFAEPVRRAEPLPGR